MEDDDDRFINVRQSSVLERRQSSWTDNKFDHNEDGIKVKSKGIELLGFGARPKNKVQECKEEIENIGKLCDKRRDR
jgi:hypothetical protein